MTIFLLTLFLHLLRPALTIDSYVVVMNVTAWLLFGAINGLLLYWIKPDRSVGGFLGAAMLGSGGALLGGAVAAVLYESLQTMNLVMLVLLLMTISSLFLLISNMFLSRRQLS